MPSFPARTFRTWRPLLGALLISTHALSQAAAPITIGAAEALTGPAAQYGVPIRQGFDLAVAEINAAGGVQGHPLQLLVEDEQGKKDQAINVFKKFIFRDRVLMLFGPTLSNSMFAAGPIANAAHVVAFGTSNTATGITDIGPWIFRNSPMEQDVAPVTLAHAASHYQAHKVAFIYGNDDAFTRSAYDVFRMAAGKSGLAVVDTETYAKGDVDFKAQLTKIKGSAPDLVICPCLAEEGANILLQARSLGLRAPFVGGNGFNSPRLFEIAREAAEGTVVGSPWFDGAATPANRKFQDAFRARYQTPPNQFAAQAYDAMQIVAEALRHTTLSGRLEEDRQAVRDALAQVHIEGATGHFEFKRALPVKDQPGGWDAAQKPFIYLVKGGRFTLLP
ncbi:MAG: ABC transporter substrate-binding protein [Pseudomonadota bacterium]|nr:ABC transporter substrate-binding protein [Pseudomonadota bacterium]